MYNTPWALQISRIDSWERERSDARARVRDFPDGIGGRGGFRAGAEEHYAPFASAFRRADNQVAGEFFGGFIGEQASVLGIGNTLNLAGRALCCHGQGLLETAAPPHASTYRLPVSSIR
jgi:hypothetical protein